MGARRGAWFVGGFALAIITREMSTAIGDGPALPTASGTHGRAISRAQLRGIALVVMLAPAALTHTEHLAACSFSQDEMNEVHAVEKYRHGRFGANAEHPRLMNRAMWAANDDTCRGEGARVTLTSADSRIRLRVVDIDARPGACRAAGTPAGSES
jgi:hypothetical protein